MSCARQPAFHFLKAVLVFSGRCGRRPRCNSGLSFQSLIRMHPALAGGDPFSHPSGSSVSRPVWVPVRSAAGGLSSARSARPPPGLPGARKHSVPNRVHSAGDDLGLARPFGSASKLSHTLGLVEPPYFFLGPLPAWRAASRERPAAPIQFRWLGCTFPPQSRRLVATSITGRHINSHGITSPRAWPFSHGKRSAFAASCPQKASKAYRFKN